MDQMEDSSNNNVRDYVISKYVIKSLNSNNVPEGRCSQLIIYLAGSKFQSDKIILFGGTLKDNIATDSYLFDLASNKWEKIEFSTIIWFYS